MIAARLVPALLGGLAVAAAWSRPEDPAPTAGTDGVAVLRFEIHDEDDLPIPGRLTFVGADGPGATLFTNPAARPRDLAVRKDVVYTLSGRGAITVPPGAYTVYASRGIEWSLDQVELEVAFEAGEEYASGPRPCEHEVDTSGWVSGDFHLHTLTYSGHGDSRIWRSGMISARRRGGRARHRDRPQPQHRLRARSKPSPSVCAEPLHRTSSGNEVTTPGRALQRLSRSSPAGRGGRTRV